MMKRLWGSGKGEKERPVLNLPLIFRLVVDISMYLCARFPCSFWDFAFCLNGLLWMSRIVGRSICEEFSGLAAMLLPFFCLLLFLSLCLRFSFLVINLFFYTFFLSICCCCFCFLPFFLYFFFYPFYSTKIITKKEILITFLSLPSFITFTNYFHLSSSFIIFFN